jgi:glutathione peroxidase
MTVKTKSGPKAQLQASNSLTTQFYRMTFTALLLVVLMWLFWPKEAVAMNCSKTLSHTFLRLQDEAPQNLCQYQGKVVLIVNTASYCGFTGQYDGLEKLYSQYKDKGLVILGFPSNDFGKQEPGSNKEIADFCHNTYGVKFPMFAKSSVTGPNVNPLFKHLIEQTGTKPRWNFYKYLVDRQGNVVDAYSSMTSPSSSKLVAQLEKLLQEIL